MSMQSFGFVGYGICLPLISKEVSLDFIKSREGLIRRSIDSDFEATEESIKGFEDSQGNSGFSALLAEIMTAETNIRFSCVQNDCDDYIIFELAMPFGYNATEAKIKSKKDLDVIFRKYINELRVSKPVNIEYQNIVITG